QIQAVQVATSPTLERPEPGEIPTERAVNPDALAGLAQLQRAGQESFVGRMIDLFLRDADTRRAAIGKAVREADSDQLARTAHSLKSSSGVLGASHLSELCLNLERMGREQELAEAAATFQEFESELSRVQDELRAYAEDHTQRPTPA
ncbi:MAG: HPt (histidine-containing phosphotransfer) domain-containing protein, partial [Myxococcota bacterium]